MKYLVFLFALSCAQVDYLGLKEHPFASQPRKVIWFQVAGFDEKQLGLLKFTEWDQSRGQEYDNFICIGKFWDYSLFDLRPTADMSMLGQVVGKGNQKGKCTDYKETPYWSILTKMKGFRSYVIESGGEKSEEILNSVFCDSKNEFISHAALIKRNNTNNFGSKFKNRKDFHFNENSLINPGDIYFDKTCKGDDCFSTLLQVAESLYQRNLRNESKYIFHVRDFNYGKYLAAGKFKKAAGVLKEIQDVIKFFKEKYPLSEVLYLVSGAKSLMVDFPEEGKKWETVEDSGKGIVVRKTSLQSTILAQGARAENFCGFYGQADIFKRLFYSEKKLKLGLDFL